MKSLLLLTIVSALLCGCSNSNELEEKLKIMRNSKIDVPFSSFEYLGDKEFNPELSNYLLVSYYDSNDCIECLVKHMCFWEAFKNDILKQKLPIDICLVLSPPKEQLDNMKEKLSGSDMVNNIYIDKNGLLLKNNEVIPKETMFHTFLLNRKHEILIIGNPLENEKVKLLLYNVAKDNGIQ